MITLTPITNPEGATQQEYNTSQEVLIPVVDSTSEFDPVTDEVVFSVETVTGELLASEKVSNFSIRNNQNTINEEQISSIIVFPTRDIENAGYNIGNFNVYYNFYRTALESNLYKFFIQEISSNRTELRLSVNNLSNDKISSLVQEFQTLLESNGFKDFYIKIGNFYYIANNILLDDSSVPSTILIKLYQPLPTTISLNTQLQVVFETAETQGFNLNLPPIPIVIEDNIEYIKGPNFNYQLSDQVNNSTVEENYTSLIENTQLTSSYNELENILNQRGITVNVDYTNFNNFIQFSSIEQRIRNFYYKIGQIESYNNSITTLNTITGATSSSLQVSSSKENYESQITSLIQNFDGYENYLYYTSGALAYPKSNSTQPYTLQSTGSTEVLNWLGSINEASPYYGGRLLSASTYDSENQDNLFNTVPTYLSEDPANQGYELFLNMIGQHFDILYSYINTLTDRYNADNRLDFGISKDLVSDALRGAGLKLYQNNFSSDDLYSALLGINASGSLLPPTGSEVIETYVTASNKAIPLENVNKETYKRLYHNLPYLLKKKGTVEGLRALINCFGIPDTILRISEFGGKDKDNSNDWDYFQNEFNYSIFNSGSSTTSRVEIDWNINSGWNGEDDNPESLFLRFKPANILPSSNEYSTISTGNGFYLTLAYTGSGYTSSSYSGSIPSSSNNYATLTLWNGTDELTHVDAPFYDENWWGVQVSREGVESNAEVTLRTANSIYNGNDGFKIGYTASSIVTDDFLGWTASNSIFIPKNTSSPLSLGGVDYYGLTGSFQEVRFYNTSIISEATFHDYVMNPHSIEGINYSSSADNLIFRAPLGSDLNTSTGLLTSIHPKVTGSYITNSFSGNSNYTIESDMTYVPQTEYVYYDQPAVGIKNRISEKIRIEEEVVPTGDTLSPYRSIQQNYPQSESYTRDVNYVEVAFSPQNEINDDINSSMGYFNIGDYIGDPALFAQSGSSYPPLDKLRDTYFEKYYANYNWTDYIRLIKYFDNSLFKMIKDFIPARTSLASGVVIKQHLLERNRQQPAQVETSQHVYSGSIESGFIDGGDGGSMPPQNNFPTSKVSSYKVYDTLTPLLNSQVGTNYSDAKGVFESIPSLSNYYFKIKNEAIDKFNPVVITPFIYFNYDLGISDQYTASLYSWVETMDESTVLESQISGTLAFNPSLVGQSAPVQIQLPSSFAKKDKIYLLTLQSGSAAFKVTGSLSTWITNDYLTLSSYTGFPSATTPVNREDQSEFYYVNNSPTPDLLQVYNKTIDTPVGPQIITNSDENEFYNGEFSGSEVLVTNGDLNPTRVIETANVDSGFIAPYNEVYVDETPNQNIDGWFNIQRGNFSETTGFIVYKNDFDGVDRSSFWSSLTPGSIIQLNTIGGTPTTLQFTVEFVQQIFNIFDIQTTPQTYGGNWYNPAVGAQAFTVNVINDPSITNIQASILGDEPLLNNVPNNRLSNIYQDIDYSTGTITPTNISVIQAGTATKFPIPDSNYSQKSWSNGRYNGSKVSSPTFNR